MTGTSVVLLSKDEARDLTTKIKGYAGALWQLLYKAHQGRAWKPLGYQSWAEYLDEEFEISRSRGYQFIDHARKVYELADAADVDVSTFVDTLSEGQTRSLNIEATAAKIAKAVKALGPEATEQQRAAVVTETIERQTTKFAAKPEAPAPAGVDPETGEISPPEATDTASAEPGDDEVDAVGASTSEATSGASASPLVAENASEDSSRSDDADPAAGSTPPAGSRLRSVPQASDDGPAAGDLVDWHPTAGQWSSYREFHVSESAKSFALLMDRRSPRAEEEDMAGLCPPSMRKCALFAAQQNAAYWTALAAGLENPTRLSAVEA